MRAILIAVLAATTLSPALAGPPYVTDDPTPTPYQHWEIYVFGSGSSSQGGSGGAAGLDFNYGAGEDLQLSMTLPVGYDNPSDGGSTATLGNIELAAKFRFLHQERDGWDASVFPRVFLPAGSAKVGERHASLLLPVWIGKSWNEWSTFGGGGCVLNHGDGSKNFCIASWAITRQVLHDLQLGVEIHYQSASEIGGQESTSVGFGGTYDLDDNWHLLASFGPGIQNAEETNQYAWYAALGYTF